MKTYSGAIQDGWRENASYDRLQYGGMIAKAEIGDFIDYALGRFGESERSRLDLRIKVRDFSRMELGALHRLFPQLEISALFNPENFEEVVELTICSNDARRGLRNEEIVEVSDGVRKNVERVDGLVAEFSKFAVKERDTVRKKGIDFVSSGYRPDELYRLWSTTFGWNNEQCEEYASEESRPEGANIFGLRNQNRQLIAAVLISDNETTEWAVCQSLRGSGYIVPLLLYANCWWAVNHGDQPLYAHLRVGRSVSPAIKSGMEVYAPADKLSILTNHVTVSTEEPAESYNVSREVIPGLEVSALRSFVTGQLNPKKLPEEVLEAYMSQ